MLSDDRWGDRIKSMAMMTYERKIDKTFTTLYTVSNTHRTDYIRDWISMVAWVGSATSIIMVSCQTKVHPPTHSHTTTLGMRATTWSIDVWYTPQNGFRPFHPWKLRLPQIGDAACVPCLHTNHTELNWTDQDSYQCGSTWMDIQFMGIGYSNRNFHALCLHCDVWL